MNIFYKPSAADPPRGCPESFILHTHCLGGTLRNENNSTSKVERLKFPHFYDAVHLTVDQRKVHFRRFVFTLFSRETCAGQYRREPLSDLKGL